MSRYGEIIPIRDKEEPIPGEWLYPHYSDDRFINIQTEGKDYFPSTRCGG